MSFSDSEIQEDSEVPIDCEDDTPSERFLRACEYGDLSLALALLHQDKTLVHTKDSDEYTPLHRASYNNHPIIIKALIEGGASLSSRTVDGRTPLHSACSWNNFECVSLLLNEGADINAQTNSGQTPLHLAASNRNAKQTLQLLLFNPLIDTTVKNSIGETAKQLAIRCGPHSYLFNGVDPILDPFPHHT